MELKYLQEFCVLAETGSFSKAAKASGTSQPLLTRHIQKLEQELGYPLFDRTTRQVSLNQEGKLFFPYAQQAVAALESFQRRMNETSPSPEQKILRIGLHETFSRSSIHNAISHFVMQMGISPEYVTIGDPAQLPELLCSGRVDTVLAYETKGEKDGEFARQTYFSDVLAAVLPQSHPLTGASSLPVTQLEGENFIFLEPHLKIGQLAIDCCEAAGFSPKIIHASKFEDNVLEMVRKEMGVSILLSYPRSAQGVVIVELEPEVNVDLNILTRKDDPNPILRDFLAYIKTNPAGTGGR